MNTLWYELRDDARSELILSKIQSENFKEQVETCKTFCRDLRIFLIISSQLNCSSENFPFNVWCKEIIVQAFKIDLRLQFADI